MTISEALASVGQHYVPGVVDYYAALKPNPWQSAHDQLELVLSLRDPAMMSAAVEAFHTRCLELIDRFKREGSPAKTLEPADAFAMGSVPRVDAYFSRREKACVHCSSKTQLQIVPSAPGSFDMVIVCKPCQAKRRKVAG